MSDSATLWTIAHQAPLSMGFSRQESWSRLPCPPPGVFSIWGSNSYLLFVSCTVLIVFQDPKRLVTLSERVSWAWEFSEVRDHSSRLVVCLRQGFTYFFLLKLLHCETVEADSSPSPGMDPHSCEPELEFNPPFQWLVRGGHVINKGSSIRWKGRTLISQWVRNDG